MSPRALFSGVDDPPVNQFGLPWAAVPGETTERVLDASEFEAWAALRAVKCGHKELAHAGCRWCAGTLIVAESIGFGNVAIRLYPAVL